MEKSLRLQSCEKYLIKFRAPRSDRYLLGSQKNISVTSVRADSLLSALMGSADFKSLEDELIDNVEKDVRYWQQNDAKVRAVKSVSTYQEFR